MRAKIEASGQQDINQKADQKATQIFTKLKATVRPQTSEDVEKLISLSAKARQANARDSEPGD